MAAPRSGVTMNGSRPHPATRSGAQYTLRMHSVARHLLAFLLCLSLLNNGMGAAWAAAWNPASACSHAPAAGLAAPRDSGQAAADHAMHDGMHHTGRHQDGRHQDGMQHDHMHHEGMTHDGMTHDGMQHAGMALASGHCGTCDTATGVDAPSSPGAPDCGCSTDGCTCLIACMAVLWPATSLPTLALLPQRMQARLHPQAHPAPPLPYPLRPPIG